MSCKELYIKYLEESERRCVSGRIILCITRQRDSIREFSVPKVILLLYV